MSMSAVEAFREYMAVRNHFNNKSYDYIKYKGKVKVNPKTFEARKDRFFFEKLSKHPDIKNFLIANFCYNEKCYIRDLAYSENAEKVYKDWLKRQQSLGYCIKNDLSKLDSDFDKNLVIKDNEHPILLRNFLSGDVSLETLCILLDITGAKKHWDNKMVYDIIWETISNKVEKYSLFLVYDKEKVRKIIVDYFSE